MHADAGGAQKGAQRRGLHYSAAARRVAAAARHPPAAAAAACASMRASRSALLPDSVRRW